MNVDRDALPGLPRSMVDAFMMQEALRRTEQTLAFVLGHLNSQQDVVAYHVRTALEDIEQVRATSALYGPGPVLD